MRMNWLDRPDAARSVGVERDLRDLERQHAQRRARLHLTRAYGLAWLTSALIGATCIASGLNDNTLALIIGFGALLPLAVVTVAQFVTYVARYVEDDWR